MIIITILSFFLGLVIGAIFDVDDPTGWILVVGVILACVFAHYATPLASFFKFLL
jgi:hypothetical protein